MSFLITGNKEEDLRRAVFLRLDGEARRARLAGRVFLAEGRRLLLTSCSPPEISHDQFRQRGLMAS